MASNVKVRVEVIHDREGDGFCGLCQRNGLRWVVQLSDGSEVGIECAKKILGYRPAPKSYNWIAEFDLVGMISRPYETFGWYVSKSGKTGRITINGVLQCSGPVDWAKGELKRYAA